MLACSTSSRGGPVPGMATGSTPENPPSVPGCRSRCSTPFHGYKNAINEHLRDATAVVYDVRRRVQHRAP